MAMQVALLDLGVGNMHSVERALAVAASRSGRSVSILRSASADAIVKADAIVAPGQGGFASGAQALAGGVAEALLEALRRGTPYFGICLGLQLLFETSAEAPGVSGLGWFSGTVEALDPRGVKIPHMGWNQIEWAGPGHRLLRALGPQGAWAYFVHSYHAHTTDPVVCATATHGNNRVTAAVARDQVFATQFHPEKSQAGGLAMLTAFLEEPL